jgi:hypothetical protein
MLIQRSHFWGKVFLTGEIDSCQQYVQLASLAFARHLLKKMEGLPPVFKLSSIQYTVVSLS